MSEPNTKAAVFRGTESLVGPRNQLPRSGVETLEQPGAIGVHERAMAHFSPGSRALAVVVQMRARNAEHRVARAAGARASSASRRGRAPACRRAANRARRASGSRTGSSRRLRSSSGPSCGRAAPSRSRRARSSCERTRPSARRGSRASLMIAASQRSACRCSAASSYGATVLARMPSRCTFSASG